MKKTVLHKQHAVVLFDRIRRFVARKALRPVQRFLRHNNPNTTVEDLHAMGLDP